MQLATNNKQKYIFMYKKNCLFLENGAIFSKSVAKDTMNPHTNKHTLSLKARVSVGWLDVYERLSGGENFHAVIVA